MTSFVFKSFLIKVKVCGLKVLLYTMAVAYKLTKYSGITKESNNANDLELQSVEISKNITGLIFFN